ncbi:MAG TPA: hypothetical protein VLG50_07870 [Candidatus Saccharimonadales bacterium]|nr:hypothetical protein [Candidatus Saccharimonadales bacterium]
METLNDDVLLNIILNTPIEDLNRLYDTNQKLKRLLNATNTLRLLSKQNNINYMDNMTFKDFLIEYFDIFFFPKLNESKYLEGELLRAAVVIRNRYLNSGDKIIHCDDYSVSWICQAKRFLEQNGYQKDIDLVPIKNKQYKLWINRLIHKIVHLILSKHGVYTPLVKGHGFESMKVKTRYDDDSYEW